MEIKDERSFLLPKKGIEKDQDVRHSHFKLEPPYLLVIFGFSLVTSTFPNHLLKQICLSKGFNIIECSKMVGNNNTKNIEEVVQPQVAAIMMTISVLNSVVSGVLTMFLGPWSDKAGRKKVILATFLGFLTGCALLGILSFVAGDRRVNPWINVVAYLPIVFTGGETSLILSSLCYLTDITNETNRSFRLTSLEILTFVAVLCGVSSSSFILKLISPTEVFLISALCGSFATIYTIFYLDESVKMSVNSKLGAQIKELLSIKLVTEMLSTSIKKRSFNERKILWCLITVLTLNHLSVTGTATVFYLFVREKFNWNLKEETLFKSASLIILIVGSFAGMTVFRKLKFSDISILTVAIISILVDSIVKLTSTSEEMYFTSGIAMFKILLAPTCRSSIAFFIPNTEVGKIFTITSAMESVLSMFASPLYTFVYANTFKFFAGAFYLITISICLVNLSLICVVRRMKKVREALMNNLEAGKAKV